MSSMVFGSKRKRRDFPQAAAIGVYGRADKRMCFKSRRPTSLNQKVNRILSRQEKKNFDVDNTAGVAIPAALTPTIVPLTTIVEGSDDGQRDGRKICINSLYTKLTVKANNDCRIIIFTDLESKGVATAPGDLLEVPSSVYSPMQMAFKKRFIVHYDSLNNQGKAQQPYVYDNAFDITYTDILFRKLDLDVEYGGIGNVPTSGSINMFIGGSNVVALGRVFFYNRIRYTDN